MVDRAPTKPNRYAVYDENHNFIRYEYHERADEPTQTGDALNKANLLPDAVATALGLTGNPQVKDALEKLSEATFKKTVISDVMLNMGTALSTATRWQSIAYGNSKFVMIQYDGSKTVYSADGVSWTAGGDLPSSNNWRTLFFDGSKFIALGAAKGAYSTNGTSWTALTIEANTDWNAIAYGSGKYVAVPQNSCHKFMHSSDGISWTTYNAPTEASVWGIAFGNGVFVAVAYNKDSVYTSTDGVNWTAVSVPLNYWRSVAFGNGVFIAVSNKLGGTKNMMYSADGSVWIEVEESLDATDIFFANNWFVSRTSTGIKIGNLTDGWIYKPTSFSARIGAYGNNKWVLSSYANDTNTSIYFNDTDIVFNNYLGDAKGSLFDLPYAKIVTGSYTGTGTFGEGNPTIITSDFPIKMIALGILDTCETSRILTRQALFNLNACVLGGDYVRMPLPQATVEYIYFALSSDGKTVRFYSNSSYNQYNAGASDNGGRFKNNYYVAIG